MKNALRAVAAMATVAAALAAPVASRPSLGGDAPPEAVTFHKDVMPIIQANCQDCHRPSGANLAGMVAPMPFTTFEEVRPWAKAIAASVQSRAMPPWHANEKTHGVFKNERTLTAEEIETITAWVATGARRGNPAEAPEPRSFPDYGGWSIGKPDLIVTFDEPFLVEEGVEDLYANITVTLSEDQLPEDRWIKAVQFRPGSQAVHHVIGHQVTPGERARQSIGAFDEGLGRGMFGGMAPGTDPHVFPDGYGRLLKKGSSLVFAMHYHKEPGPGTAVMDNSAVAFIFADEPIQHNVRWDAIGNRQFEIPPGHPNWEVGAARVFEKDTTLLAFLPHMHLRGKAARYIAFYPDGTQETLLEVERYDFNWQTNYVYEEPKRIPGGTRIEVTMWFDNSAARQALAPIDTRRAVRFGGPTTDEMMLGWIDYTETEPRDYSAKGKR